MSVKTWRYLSVLILILVGDLALGVPANSDEVVRVKRVSDGDTILLEDGRKVRYLGINAPEFLEPFYFKAKWLNQSLVLGREIRLEFDEEKTDGYNRLLAYVYVGEQMVNAKLVEEGLAHAFFIGPNHRHNELLLRLQAEAKQRKVGMWSARTAARELKITNVCVAARASPCPHGSYVRIASLSSETIKLAGYVLSNETGQRYVFPDVSLNPGYTVLVANRTGIDGIDSKGQLVVHWQTQLSVWDPREDTAFLWDPAGNLVDTYHYRGKIIRRSPSRSRGKSP